MNTLKKECRHHWIVTDSVKETCILCGEKRDLKKKLKRYEPYFGKEFYLPDYEPKPRGLTAVCQELLRGGASE